MIGAATQEQRSGHWSDTQQLTCVGVHVDAGLAKPVRPRTFCEYTAPINVSLHTSVILFSQICLCLLHVHVLRVVVFFMAAEQEDRAEATWPKSIAKHWNLGLPYDRAWHIPMPKPAGGAREGRILRNTCKQLKCLER